MYCSLIIFLRVTFRSAFISIIISFLAVFCTENGQDVTVSLGENQNIVGFLQTVSELRPKKVKTFLGIPYAEPPTESYRFARPQPKKPWQGNRDAKNMPATCYQYLPTTGFDHNNTAAKMWYNNTEMSEDCLYLNIWAPERGQNLPVMVWIYGGAYYSGSSTLDVYDGTYLAALQDVIVVSMQYRLGAFGFLYIPEEEHKQPNTKSETSNPQSESRPKRATGNQALYDVQMALSWIVTNSGFFGGDPNKITIFGESAGAAITSLIYVAPGTKSIAQNIILQSASFYAYWSLDTAAEAQAKSQKFIESLDCSSRPSREEKLNCLQQKTATELVNKLDAVYTFTAQRRNETFHNCLLNQPCNPIKDKPNKLPGQITGVALLMDSSFRPMVDGDFLPKHPDKLLDDKVSPNVLAGVNRNEGMFWLLYALGINKADFLQDDGQIVMPEVIESISKGEIVEGEQVDLSWLVAARILDRSYIRPGLVQKPVFQYGLPSMYKKNLTYASLSDVRMTGEELMTKLDGLYGDLAFKCPTLQFLEKAAGLDNPKLYLYDFNHKTAGAPLPKWVGVMHGYEIEYVFGMPYSNKFQTNFYRFTEKEKQLSNEVMRMWANFAKTGDPNNGSNEDTSKTTWPLYTNETVNVNHTADHFVFSEASNAAYGLVRKECNFWLQEMPFQREVLQKCCKKAADCDKSVSSGKTKGTVAPVTTGSRKTGGASAAESQ